MATQHVQNTLLTVCMAFSIRLKLCWCHGRRSRASEGRTTLFGLHCLMAHVVARKNCTFSVTLCDGRRCRAYKHTIQRGAFGRFQVTLAAVADTQKYAVSHHNDTSGSTANIDDTRPAQVLCRVQLHIAGTGQVGGCYRVLRRASVVCNSLFIIVAILWKSAVGAPGARCCKYIHVIPGPTLCMRTERG